MMSTELFEYYVNDSITSLEVILNIQREILKLESNFGLFTREELLLVLLGIIRILREYNK